MTRIGLVGLSSRFRLLLVAGSAMALLMVTLSASARAASPDPVGTIYVADYEANAIDVFAPGANGNVAPIRRITGPDTQLGGPADVAVDSAGDVYSSNFNTDTITEYAPGANGDATPIRTIGGSNTQLSNNDDISLTPDGTLYIGNFGGTSVVVFGPGASGNVAPERTISGNNTGLSGVDGVGADASGTLYADFYTGVAVFAPGANGNVAPIRTITGSNTTLQSADDVKVGFSGQLVVTDGTGAIDVFAAGANGNVAPVQRIAGSNTGISDLDDLAVDASGNMYVTNFNSDGVEEFASSANGNVAPIAHLSGSNTTFLEPEGVAVATPTSNLSVTTSATSPISLGESTQDTATFSGGNAPTGSLLFNLYGPSDPGCTGAPAFTSSPITVSGNGNYQSPTFAPKTSGSYSWVAVYSGDVNNPPVTTACSDPAEQVSVAAFDAAITATGGFTLKGTVGKAVSGTVATFKDLDTSAKATEYSASINWGDGSTSTGTISGSPSDFTVSGTHTYSNVGSYKITVTITDIDNKPNSATASDTATISKAAHSVKAAKAAVSAKLSSVPTACVSSAFTARVQGKRIASVRFTLDGRRMSSTTVKRHQKYSGRIRVTPGHHTLTVKITFLRGSAARYRTFHRAVTGCTPAPSFTG